jgi:hypothetical protein
VNRAAQAVAAAQAAQAVAAAQTRAIQLRDASIMNWAMRRHPGEWEGTFGDFYKNGGSRIGGLAQEKARDSYRQSLANSGGTELQPRPSGRGSEQEKAPFQRQWGAALAVGKKANWDPLVTQQGVNAAIMDTMIGHPRVAARIRNAWAQTPQDPQARVKYLEGQYASTKPAQTEPRPQGSGSEADAAQTAEPQPPQTEPRPSGSGSEPEAAPDEAAAQPEEEQ